MRRSCANVEPGNRPSMTSSQGRPKICMLCKRRSGDRMRPPVPLPSRDSVSSGAITNASHSYPGCSIPTLTRTPAMPHYSMFPVLSVAQNISDGWSIGTFLSRTLRGAEFFELGCKERRIGAPAQLRTQLPRSPRLWR